MWGQGRSHLFNDITSRIIPTRVGTSLLVLCAEIFSKDHPHACGDKSFKAKLLTPTRGSSPRVWGQETVIQFSQKGCRIIPTRVGTSCSLILSCNICQDHPHACGDKSFDFYWGTGGGGSSPRVWGQGQTCFT